MNSDIKVIDNFIDFESFIRIKKLLTGSNFPWFYQDNVNHANDGFFQFTHTFYHNHSPQSRNIEDITPIVNKLEAKALIRIKANLLTKTEKIIKHGYHIDFKFNNTTGIYYVNTNNGFTEFENGTKIESVENRFVSFPSHFMHSGSSSTDTNQRIVINFNYF